MVLMQSTGSNHHIISFRERLDDKKEIIFFDPDGKDKLPILLFFRMRQFSFQ